MMRHQDDDKLLLRHYKIIYKMTSFAQGYWSTRRLKKSILLTSELCVCVCVCVCVYPSSSLRWRYGMNGNSGSCRQPS